MGPLCQVGEALVPARTLPLFNGDHAHLTEHVQVGGRPTDCIAAEISYGHRRERRVGQMRTTEEPLSGRALTALHQRHQRQHGKGLGFHDG